MESNLRDSARAAYLHVDEFAFGATGGRGRGAKAQMSPQQVRFAMAAAAVVVLLGLMFVLTH